MMETEPLRQMLLKRHAGLKSEFETWRPTLEQLAEHILPHRARFFAKDFNRGDRINDTIINNTPTIAARILASGMMAGITSPARRWFKLTTPDPELAESGPVRGWLHLVEERVRWVFARSNFYQALADGTYPDLGVFGFHASVMEESFRNVLHTEVLAIGEYFLATNDQGVVDTIHRDLPMTVRQVVRKFGREACSTAVRNSWDRSDYERVVEVIHCIRPNDEYEHGKADRHGKKWASDWMEKTGREDKFLRRAGYEEFPGICPRWLVKPNEAYGRGPGSEILGDCKALQFHEERLAGMVDKIVDPPMKGSPELDGRRQSLLPGDVTYVPAGQNPMFEPSMKIDPAAILAEEKHILRTEERIERGMFADLWMRVISDQRVQRATATEIEEGRNETMLQLGPMLERLGSELLKPSIDRAFATMLRMGLIPEAPRELQGLELKVEFESIMHQAQKAIGLGGVRTFLVEVSNLAALKPEALDKINADEFADEMAAMAGIKPDMLLTDEEVGALRQRRAEREQALQQGAAMAEMAKGAKALGTTPAPAPDNALGSVLQQLGPLAGAGGPLAGGGGVH